MKRFDMHIHLDPPLRSAQDDTLSRETVANLAAAGLAGGCIFSPNPKTPAQTFRPDEERINALLAYTRGQEGRLFPVFWVHPDEPDAQAHVLDAAQKGVAAYKFICDSYYVYEEKCMKLLRLIASLGKPVIFHSGILWSGSETSKYNRPLHWEALIDVHGLRFSMGHCSWPWHDECIAMYGKFLHHLIEYKSDCPCEMFFDITPGTPPIYRRDLLYKLFHIGYDVENNVMFGTDSIITAYNPGWVQGWMQRDDALYAEFGLSEQTVEKIYCGNLMRFLGVSGEKVTHIPPSQTEESRIRL